MNRGRVVTCQDLRWVVSHCNHTSLIAHFLYKTAFYFVNKICHDDRMDNGYVPFVESLCYLGMYTLPFKLKLIKISFRQEARTCELMLVKSATHQNVIAEILIWPTMCTSLDSEANQQKCNISNRSPTWQILLLLLRYTVTYYVVWFVPIHISFIYEISV